MSTGPTDSNPAADLGLDDLEAAVRLLTQEAGAIRTDRRKLLSVLAKYIAVALILFACPIGVLTLFFNASMGLALLGLAVAAFLLIAITPGETSADKARSLFKDNPLEKTIASVWDKRSSAHSVARGCGYLVGAVTVVAGIIVLIVSLITTHEPSVLSLVLILAPLVLFFIEVGVGTYQEIQYYSQVAKARGQIEAMLKQATAEGASSFSVSAEDKQLLAQVELNQITRQAHETAQQLSKEPAAWYGVIFAPEVMDYLKQLSDDQREARYAVREAADSLPMNPRPPGARPAIGHPNGWVIQAGNYRITYLIDDAQARIDVIKIETASGGEVSHAA